MIYTMVYYFIISFSNIDPLISHIWIELEICFIHNLFKNPEIYAFKVLTVTESCCGLAQ